MAYTPRHLRPGVNTSTPPTARKQNSPDEANPWPSFVARYAEDPILFVREVLGADPHPNQIELLEAYQRRDRLIAMKSGHRVGKTTSLAWVIVHQLVCRGPQKTVCTAPTTKQLFEALYAETVTHLRKLPPKILDLFEIKSEDISLKSAPTESFVSFRTSSAEKPEALAGVHSTGWVLLICDEASGIPESILEGAIGSLAGPRARQILAGNPVRRTGLFYDIWHRRELREKWIRISVSCVGHPNVDPTFIDDVASRYGELSNAYRVRVLGEFPLVDDDTVIPFSLLEPALNRDVKAKHVRSIWGLDVARKGRDACALARRQGNKLEEKVRTWYGKDTMQTVGIVKALWEETPLPRRPEFIFVDAIGLGAGVADRLRELDLPAVAINVSESAALVDKYPNLRSELWFRGRAWLERKDCSIAGDDDLAHELAQPTWEDNTKGKSVVEGKKKTMKRTGEPSPNRADAFLLTLVQDAATAQGLTSTGPGARWNQPLEMDIGSLC